MIFFVYICSDCQENIFENYFDLIIFSFLLKMNLFRQMSLLVIGINREAQVDDVKIFQHLVEY
jgi:hypothetical protein